MYSFRNKLSGYFLYKVLFFWRHKVLIVASVENKLFGLPKCKPNTQKRTKNR